MEIKLISLLLRLACKQILLISISLAFIRGELGCARDLCQNETFQRLLLVKE